MSTASRAIKLTTAAAGQAVRQYFLPLALLVRWVGSLFRPNAASGRVREVLVQDKLGLRGELTLEVRSRPKEGAREAGAKRGSGYPAFRVSLIACLREADPEMKVDETGGGGPMRAVVYVRPHQLPVFARAIGRWLQAEPDGEVTVGRRGGARVTVTSVTDAERLQEQLSAID